MTNETTITHNGKTLTYEQWDKINGFPKGTVRRRVVINKWPEQEAVTKPLTNKAGAGRKGARRSPWRFDSGSKFSNAQA